MSSNQDVEFMSRIIATHALSFDPWSDVDPMGGRSGGVGGRVRGARLRRRSDPAP
jgi:hypothetical protein